MIPSERSGAQTNRDRKGRGGIAWRTPRNCLQLDIWTGVDFYVQQGAILHKMASVDVLQANTYGSKAPATKRRRVLLTLAGRPEFGNLTVKEACVPKSGSRTGFCEDLEKGIVAIEKGGRPQSAGRTSAWPGSLSDRRRTRSRIVRQEAGRRQLFAPLPLSAASPQGHQPQSQRQRWPTRPAGLQTRHPPTADGSKTGLVARAP